jgi:hypothetical protein
MQKRAILSFLVTTATLLLIATPTLAEPPNTLLLTNLNGGYITVTYEQLQTMPKTVVNADLFCDGALVTSGNWDGVQLSYLLSLNNLTSQTGPAQSIQFTASDGYSAYIPINLALDPNTIIAYGKDDVPLNEGLRLVLPGYNGASWIAMIATITMSASGAQSPLGISAGPGAISSGTAQQSNTPKAQQTPTPTPITLQPTSTPAPTPTSPTNGTLQNQPVPKEQTNLNTSTSQSPTFLAAILGVLICGSAAVLAFYLHKKHVA